MSGGALLGAGDCAALVRIIFDGHGGAKTAEDANPGALIHVRPK